MTPKNKTKKPHNPKHRTVSFRKARLMREAEEAALNERLEQHADMELEQAAELAADIRGEEE